MARAWLVLLVLIAPALLLAHAGPSEAQVPPGFGSIPTEQKAQVGGLNVTTWIMRDTRSIVTSPESLRDNPLSYLWNLNFTAGSFGVFYAKAEIREPDVYEVRFTIRSASPYVAFANQRDNASEFTSKGRYCTVNDARDVVQCPLNEGNASADHAFQFLLANAAPAGTLGLDLDVVAFRNTTGTPVHEANRTLHYDINVLDPVPPFAVSSTVGATSVHAWINGGPLGTSGSGCLGGSATGRDENVSAGRPAVLCVLSITRSETDLRLTVEPQAPTWMLIPAPSWVSEPFNLTSGGSSAPVQGFSLQPAQQAPVGANAISVLFTLERKEGDAWVEEGAGELVVPFMVTPATVVIPTGSGINWIAHAPVLVVAVGGLGYLAYTSRQPKFQKRSQAMQAEVLGRRKRGASEAPAEVSKAQVDLQKQQVHEAAWEKKRKILDAKRDDILKSIRIAEERLQRGEITEHVFKGIKERKERQLEQVQKEMEELQG